MKFQPHSQVSQACQVIIALGNLQSTTFSNVSLASSMFLLLILKMHKNGNYLKEQKGKEEIKMKSDKLFLKRDKEIDGSFGKKSFCLHLSYLTKQSENMLGVTLKPALPNFTFST